MSRFLGSKIRHLHRLNPQKGIDPSGRSDTAISDTTILNPMALPVNGHWYVLTGTDTLSGCSLSDSVRVTPVSFTISYNDSVYITPGQTATLAVTGGFYYHWTADPTLSDTTIWNPVARPCDTTTYYFETWDACACDTIPGEITVFVSHPNYRLLSRDTTICLGDSLTLTASGTANYSWTPGNDSTATIGVVPGQTTTYVVSMWDIPACVFEDSLLVTVDTFSLVSGILLPDTSVCHLDSIQLLAIPGHPFYSWTPSSTLSDTIIADPMAGPLATTQYFVTVTDSNGCSLTDSILVQVDSTAFPIAFLDSDSLICLGDTAKLYIVGPSPNTVISWTPTYNVVVVADTQACVYPAVDTTYYVSITDTLTGCTWSDSVFIDVNLLPLNFAIVPGDTTVCYGDSLTFGVTNPAVQYSWSNGDTSATTGQSWYASGTLDVWAYYPWGTAGCSAWDTITVTVDSVPLTAQLLSNNQAICLGDSLQLFATGAGQYSWSPGVSLDDSTLSAPTAGPSATTVYTVTMTNSGFCFVEDSLTITVDSVAPTGTLAISDTVFCGGDTLTLTASGGTFYTWISVPGGNLISPTNGAVQTASPTGTATYYVSVSDGGACQWQDSVLTVDSSCCDVPGATLLFSPRASAWAWSNTNASFHIVDTFRVDTNIFFGNCTFWMDSAAVIFVEIGDTLNVQGSEFYPACSTMWEGIVLENGGARLISKTNRFEQAEHAVYARGGASFDIVTSTFEANYIGVEVDSSPATSAYPGSITTSTFLGGALLPPYNNAFASYAGVKVNNVQGLTIGASGFDGSAYNTFEDLEHGVHILRSDVTLYHNQFRDINRDPSATSFGSGSAIFSNAAAPTTFEERLTVGLESGYSGQDLIDYGNVFDDCYYGVHARNSMDVFVRGNDLDSVEHCGIFVTRLLQDSLYVERNDINQSGLGIQAGNMRETTAKIYENVIFGDSLAARHGIRFDQVWYPSLDTVDTLYPFTVSYNDIRVQGNGIWMVDVDHVNVQENYIFLKLPAGANPTTTLNGVYLAAASGPNRIITNDVRSYERTWETDSLVGVRGIYVESSPETSVNCNDVRDVGRCFEWRNNCAPSDMYKNLMINAVDGIAVRDLGEIGPQGSGSVPADNRWQGSNFVNGQTHSISSVGTDSKFFVRYSTVYYPTLNDTSGFPLIPMDFDSVPSTSYDSVICTYRGTGIHILNSMLDIIQNRYGDGFYSNVTQFNADHWLIRSIIRDTTYISLEPEIEEFWNTYQDSAITLATKVMEAIAANDSSGVQSLLGSYAPMRVIEEYLEDVFEIELDLIGSDNGLDATAFETLQNLAGLCPLEGGLAVHRARSSLSMAGYPSWDYDDCASDWKARISNASPSSSSGRKLEIWPNPAYEVVNVRFLGRLSPGSKIQVVDGYGHILTAREFDHVSREAVFQTDKWSDGLYSVRVIEPNGKSHFGKVLIIHQ